jgi:type 1 glutamine amidotransferase
LLVCDPFDHDAHESLTALEQHLEARSAAECRWALRRATDELPGWEDLEQSECLVLFARRTTLHNQRLHRLRRYCDRGGAIVGIGAMDARSPVWSSLDHEVFGGLCLGGYDNPATAVRTVEAAQGHPILGSVEPFFSASPLSKNLLIADPAVELLYGSTADHRHLVAWARPYRAGRVFYTSLGHPDDFGQESFLRLLGNAIDWSCGRLG